jgi:thiol-disulfide isomerase/thioredoxin
MIAFALVCSVLFICIKYINPITAQYHSFGNLDAEDQYPIPDDWGIRYANTNMSNANSKDKVVVLNFWSVRCPKCFSEMPILDSLNTSFKANSRNIELISVFVQFRQNDSALAMSKMQPYHYSFPIAIGDSSNLKTFQFKYFPTIIIVRDGVVLFKGNLEKALDYIAKLPQ